MDLCSVFKKKLCYIKYTECKIDHFITTVVLINIQSLNIQLDHNHHFVSVARGKWMNIENIL